MDIPTPMYCIYIYVHVGIEQKDRSMAASIQFHIGNKCYFHIDGKRMSGEIAALNVMPGMHSVSWYTNIFLSGKIFAIISHFYVFILQVHVHKNER